MSHSFLLKNTQPFEIIIHVNVVEGVRAQHATSFKHPDLGVGTFRCKLEQKLQFLY
jgi:hypothetical protein